MVPVEAVYSAQLLRESAAFWLWAYQYKSIDSG